MALRYDKPGTSTLHQGEILCNIWVHIVKFPLIETQPNQILPTISIFNEFVVVMSPGCDLHWDFGERYPNHESVEQNPNVEESPKSLSYILVAKMYKQEDIRSYIGGSDLWRRIENNQDERYHHFGKAPLGDSEDDLLPDFYIDFKKPIALNTWSVYEGLRYGGIQRIAIIPDIYIHDLIHRFYGFLSRVAIPTP